MAKDLIENCSLSEYKENGDLYIKFTKKEIENGKKGEGECLDSLDEQIGVGESIWYFDGEPQYLYHLYSFDFDKVYRFPIKDVQNICLNGETLVLKAETPTVDDYLEMYYEGIITGDFGGLDWLIELLEKEGGYEEEVENIKEREGMKDWRYNDGEVKQYENGNLHIRFSRAEREYAKEKFNDEDGMSGLSECFECLCNELEKVNTIIFGEDMCLSNVDMGTSAYNLDNGMVYVISWSELKYVFSDNRTLILEAKEPDGWDYVELYEDGFFDKEDLEDFAQVFKMEGKDFEAKIIYDKLKSD